MFVFQLPGCGVVLLGGTVRLISLVQGIWILRSWLKIPCEELLFEVLLDNSRSVGQKRWYKK